MTKCRKCGREIRYIPSRSSPDGVLEAEPETVEVVAESGRIVRGHLLHRCHTDSGGKGNARGTVQGHSVVP